VDIDDYSMPFDFKIQLYIPKQQALQKKKLFNHSSTACALVTWLHTHCSQDSIDVHSRLQVCSQTSCCQVEVMVLLSTDNRYNAGFSSVRGVQ
jgi:hypothetical protein